jgi:hypothetical protein
MCLPIPPAAMAGMYTATAIVGSVSALAGSAAKQAEYKARSQYNIRQSQAELVKGQYEAMRLREKGERLAGRQRALFTQAGTTLEGTPESVILDSVAENELDVQAVRWGQQIAAQNYQYEAKMDLMNRKATRLAGYFEAITPLLKGSTQIGGLYAK